MIKQSLAFNDILEKKFKILRTSIMLGNLRNKEEILSEYEETAREIDNMKKNIYEEHLAAKMYTTVSLEEEETRLKDLITFIEKRIEERNDFVDDYIKITSNFLDGLDKVSLENELTSYKTRCNNIEEYLNNCEEIKRLNIKLKELRDELEEKYENKANNELINSKLEEELIDEFNKFISRDKYYYELNYTDIDFELSKLEESLIEKKTVLDTFTSSYQALVNVGISGAEREEYSSYVQEARLNYYEDIEKKCILNIYKLVLDKEVDYDKLYEKRLIIDNMLNERDRMRESLAITKRDDLEYFANLCREQFSIIKSQKFNIENIDKLILDISDCENRLSDLEEANNREEIVDLLNEFSVDTPQIEKIELPDEKKVFEETIKNVENSMEKKPANMVVKIKDPIKINVKSVTDTAKLVMKKVVIVLEPKKFNSKRDKLKEAELELKKEKYESLNNTLTDDIKTDVSDEVKEEIFKDDNIDNNDNIFLDDNNIEKKDDIIENVDNSNDIFLDTDKDNIDITGNIGINLDTKVVDDKSVKETKELTEIKINASDPSNMSIPTEIFIEEPTAEKELDLFKVTDPFLDDNHLEVNKDLMKDVKKSNIPIIGSIGTVKPNTALSQIENVVKDSNDVILPNLGLVDDVKGDVPIVSENYIS